MNALSAMMIPITDPMIALLAKCICFSSPLAVIYTTPETTNPIIPRTPIIDNKKLSTFKSIEEIGVASVITPAYATLI